MTATQVRVSVADARRRPAKLTAQQIELRASSRCAQDARRARRTLSGCAGVVRRQRCLSRDTPPAGGLRCRIAIGPDRPDRICTCCDWFGDVRSNSSKRHLPVHPAYVVLVVLSCALSPGLKGRASWAKKAAASRRNMSTANKMDRCGSHEVKIRASLGALSNCPGALPLLRQPRRQSIALRHK